MNLASWDDFQKLDIRVGEVLRVEPFDKARKPAYRMWINFGPEIGVKTSSAQFTACYEPTDLLGRQVLGVINFPPRRIADFSSEVLILGVYAAQGVVLITPEQGVQIGDRLG